MAVSENNKKLKIYRISKVPQNSVRLSGIKYKIPK